MTKMNRSEDEEAIAPLSTAAHEVRYSYLDMMREVEEERRHSVVGRELIDAVEINQIFSKRRRKIKKS
jgi:hypothetical protein